MIPSALEYFACPRCASSPLRHESDTRDGHTSDGNLVCVKCASRYPVRNAIPRFVPADNYAGSFGYQWNLHRRTQLDSHTGIPVSRERVFNVTGWPETLDGEVILEAGSGAGRFTEILLGTGATVFSFDYSAAVDANCANNGSHASLQLFQGDIFNIPLREQAFDKVFCLGVLQHTPDPEQACASLARCVKPGGQLVIDIYAKRWSALLSWKYALRPITRRLDQQRLHRIIEFVAPALVPISATLRRFAGRVGARLVPIVEYSHLGLPDELNREWAILDTFDMYAPAHDHPQTLATVQRWFAQAGFVDICVTTGPNGIVGKGARPLKSLEL